MGPLGSGRSAAAASRGLPIRSPPRRRRGADVRGGGRGPRLSGRYPALETLSGAPGPLPRPARVRGPGGIRPAATGVQMNDELVHPEAEIQELLDGRLSPELRAEVERHLAECSPCRRLRDSLSFTRSAVRENLAEFRMPGDVVIGVRTLLDGEARRTTSTSSREPVVAPRRLGRVALAAGLAAMLAVAVLLLRPDSSLPAAAARDYARVRSGRITLALPTENAGALEAYF